MTTDVMTLQQQLAVTERELESSKTRERLLEVECDEAQAARKQAEGRARELGMRLQEAQQTVSELAARCAERDRMIEAFVKRSS
jgi:chromosome segregation ATPase